MQPAAVPTVVEGARDTQLLRDLVVLDANAEIIQQMLADLLSQEDPTQPFEVALLDAPHEVVAFDAVSGQLTIRGDAGDNAVHESFTADGFLTITLDGVTRSSQSLSPFHEPSADRQYPAHEAPPTTFISTAGAVTLTGSTVSVAAIPAAGTCATTGVAAGAPAALYC